MTIIQPGNKKTFLNKVIVGLVLGAILVAFFLVSLYTRFVNLNYGIAETKKTIEEMQTGNAELKDQVFALLDRSRLESVAVERNLVKEKNPQYLQVSGEPLALSR